MNNHPRLWVYNYDFEFELAGELNIRRGRAPFLPWHALNRSWHVLLPLADATDEILVYDMPYDRIVDSLGEKQVTIPEFKLIQGGRESNAILNDLCEQDLAMDSVAGKQLCPWGWSPRTADLAAKLGLSSRTKAELETIRQINAKTATHRLRQKLLPQSARVPGAIVDADALGGNDLETLISSFIQINGPSLIKHPFGTAGRLSDRCDTTFFPDRKIRKWKNWIRKSGEILLEKRMSIRREWSVQIEFGPGRTVLPIALTRLYSGANGNYLGTVVTKRDQEMLGRFLDLLSPVTQEISNSRFSGPLGFDLIEDETGQIRLLEINGRYTMGRIGYGWHRVLDGPDVSMFSNLFISIPEAFDDEIFYQRVDKQLQEKEGVITLLNLVRDETGTSAMASLLIQGDRVESVHGISDRFRDRLKRLIK